MEQTKRKRGRPKIDAGIADPLASGQRRTHLKKQERHPGAARQNDVAGSSGF